MRVARLAAVLLFALSPGELFAQGATPDAADRAGLPAAFVRRSALRGAGKFYTAADVQKLHATDPPRLLARVTGGDLRGLVVWVKGR